MSDPVEYLRRLIIEDDVQAQSEALLARLRDMTVGMPINRVISVLTTYLGLIICQHAPDDEHAAATAAACHAIIRKHAGCRDE